MIEDQLPPRSSARQAILLHLKKSETGLTVDDLSSLLEITPMAVRRHLGVLESAGLIQAEVERRPKGRPANVYTLCESAHDLFPNNYSGLLNVLLECLEETSGPEAIRTLFERWKDKLVRLAGEEIDGLANDERRRRLAELLDDEGFMPTIETRNGRPVLKQYNCPMRKVADKYDDVCEAELQVYRELLGDGVEREQRIVEGHPCCIFRLPGDTDDDTDDDHSNGYEV